MPRQPRRGRRRARPRRRRARRRCRPRARRAPRAPGRRGGPAPPGSPGPASSASSAAEAGTWGSGRRARAIPSRGSAERTTRATAPAPAATAGGSTSAPRAEASAPTTVATAPTTVAMPAAVASPTRTASATRSARAVPSSVEPAATSASAAASSRCGVPASDGQRPGAAGLRGYRREPADRAGAGREQPEHRSRPGPGEQPRRRRAEHRCEHREERGGPRGDEAPHRPGTPPRRDECAQRDRARHPRARQAERVRPARVPGPVARGRGLGDRVHHVVVERGGRRLGPTAQHQLVAVEDAEPVEGLPRVDRRATQRGEGPRGARGPVGAADGFAAVRRRLARLGPLGHLDQHPEQLGHRDVTGQGDVDPGGRGQHRDPGDGRAGVRHGRREGRARASADGRPPSSAGGRGRPVPVLIDSPSRRSSRTLPAHPAPTRTTCVDRARSPDRLLSMASGGARHRANAGDPAAAAGRGRTVLGPTGGGAWARRSSDAGHVRPPR